MAPTRSRARGREHARPSSGGVAAEHSTKIYAVAITGIIVIIAFLALTSVGHVIDAATQHFMLFYAGVFALIALSASVGLGLVSTDRMFLNPAHRVYMQSAHRAASFGAVSFLIIHIITEILAQRVHVLDAVVPFLSPFRTFYIGLGTIASDLVLLLVITGILRGRFNAGGKAWRWRAIHYTSYASFVFGVWHGLLAGRPGKPYVDWSYGLLVVLVLLGLAVRVFSDSLKPKESLSVPPVKESAGSASAPMRAAAMFAQLAVARGNGYGPTAVSGGQPVLSAPVLTALPAGTPGAGQGQPFYEPGYEGPQRYLGAPRATGSGPMPQASTGPMARANARPLPLGAGQPSPYMSGPMPRVPTGPMPVADTGQLPPYMSGPMRRVPTGPMPRIPTGPMPVANAGQLPPYMSGPMPRIPTGPMPVADAGQLPPYMSGPMRRVPTGPMPVADTGQLPPYMSGPVPPYASGPMPRFPTGPMQQAGRGQVPPSAISGPLPVPPYATGPLPVADTVPLPPYVNGPPPRMPYRPDTGPRPQFRPAPGPMPRAATGPLPPSGDGPWDAGPQRRPQGRPMPHAADGPYPRGGSGPMAAQHRPGPWPGSGPPPPSGGVMPPARPDGGGWPARPDGGGWPARPDGGGWPARTGWQAAGHDGSRYPAEPPWDVLQETDPNLRYREPGPGMPGYRGSREHRYGGDMR